MPHRPSATLSAHDAGRIAYLPERRTSRWSGTAERPSAAALHPTRIWRNVSLSGRLTATVLLAATTFNLGLCYLNTNVFPTSATTAMVAEVIIMTIAVGLLIWKRDYLVGLIVTLICSYFAVLFLVRGAVDLKPIRDILIPVIFLHLGQRYLEPRQTDWLVTRLTVLVFAVAVVEFVFPELFTRLFDVLQYFINKGATRAQAADFIVNGFNINGDRPEGQGRELLPFLGLHRAGSIFLEPITAGNFGAICGAWFLQSNRRALSRWLWIALCFCIIVLADGRFALLLLTVAIGLRYLPAIQKPLRLSFLPIVIIGALMAYAAILDTSGFGAPGNSYGGRLLYAGRILNNLDLLDWLGMKVPEIAYFDSGYAYSVTQIGLTALLAGWFALAIQVELRATTGYLACFLMLFICLSLIISNSMWSIKASALLWFMVGQTLRAKTGTRRIRPAPTTADIGPRRVG